MAQLMGAVGHFIHTHSKMMYGLGKKVFKNASLHVIKSAYRQIDWRYCVVVVN